MRFVVIADTDIGIAKDTNQDSVCVKHAKSPVGEVLMAIVCDGMGGLAKGELASATVIREFCDWFDHELERELQFVDMKVIGAKWELMLKSLNSRILEYGKKDGFNLGTTFSGLLLIQNQYLIVHVGDSRVYHLDSWLTQMTEDQTVVERKIKEGLITREQAKTDAQKSVLLQCVGASRVVTPQIISGTIKEGAYLLCSDGFRHKISEKKFMSL